MIIFPEPCKECGLIPTPTQVACDQCGREQEIEEFTGIIVHFDLDTDELCSSNCEECMVESAEFQFCDIKCLSEYITDPNSRGFDDYDDFSVNIITDAKNLGQLLHALGRYSS